MAAPTDGSRARRLWPRVIVAMAGALALVAPGADVLCALECRLVTGCERCCSPPPVPANECCRLDAAADAPSLVNVPYEGTGQTPVAATCDVRAMIVADRQGPGTGPAGAQAGRSPPVPTPLRL